MRSSTIGCALLDRVSRWWWLMKPSRDDVARVTHSL